MMLFIKILIPLLLIAVLLAKKIRLEVSLTLGAVLLGFLFNLGAVDIATHYIFLVKDLTFWNLFFIIMSVMLLGELLEKGNYLNQMASLFLALLKDNRIAAAASTAFIGFLPMPGGSILSAPFINKLILNDDNEHKLLINYWYRHIWEYFFPLYSGMAWIITVFHADLGEIFTYMGPLALVMALSGSTLLFHSKRDYSLKVERKDIKFIRILSASWPILSAVLITLVLKIPLLFSILISIAVFLLFNRSLAKEVLAFVLKKNTISVFFMTAAMVYFSTIVKETGLAPLLNDTMSSMPIWIPLYFIPFITALLTGISVGFVSISFPILANMIAPQGVIDYYYLMIAFIGGFTGVMLSPAHLCLIVTTDYFKTSLAKVYPILMKTAVIFIISTIFYAIIVGLILK